MPLSKVKQAEYQKQRRRNLKLGMTMKRVIPKTDALQSKSSHLKDIGNSKLPPELDASGEIIPEYW